MSAINLLNKILKKSTLIPTAFYKIVIYIDDEFPYSLNIMYFDFTTEKQFEKDINILNLCSLLKSYTVIKDSLELENNMVRGICPIYSKL